MGVQISLFKSQEGPWWRGRQYAPDERVRDVLPRNEDFRSGGATLLTAEDGAVSGLARGGRRGSASDFRSNVSFDRISEITPRLFDELVAAVRPRSRGAALSIFRAGFGLLTEAASADIREWFAAHDQSASQILDDIVAAEPGWMLSSPDLAAQFRTERDAVNLALEIGGFNREQALRGVTPPSSATHFALPPDVTVVEDSIIVDDLDLFPGWDQVAAMRPSGRVFEDVATSRRLTVVLANKNKIELTTGTDLLYMVHDYKSFVVVQYKRARREHNKVLVRLDDQLDRELTRMREIESAIRQPEKPSKSLSDQRLTDAFCFFKLCQSEQPSQVDGLSLGKYVSIETWDLMNAIGLMKGPKGGRRLLLDDVTRYHNNTEFAELVSEGWVGSKANQFEKALGYLFEAYEAGRTMVLGSLNLGNSLRRRPMNPYAFRSYSVIP